VQNPTSYSCLAIPISYTGDEILHLSRPVFEIWHGQTDRRQTRWPKQKALTLIVCEP